MLDHVFTLLLLMVMQVHWSLAHWTSSGYPDLRGPSVYKCLSIDITPGTLLYICDPDQVLNSSHVLELNAQLRRLAIGTPCHCQRRSQCATGQGPTSPFHGFVVSIALVNNLQMTIHSPSEQQLTDRAEGFCRTLEGRWALGDCGNSVLIFVWKHYKKMIIRPARLAQRYVTANERREILEDVNNLIQTDKWFEALTQVIAKLHDELKGPPEDRVDTGTLSLIIAVGVACLLTLLITCCVCAFRCFGNLGSDEVTSSSKKTSDAISNIRLQIARRGSHLGNSIAVHSPKFLSSRDSPIKTSFFADTGATIV